MLKAILLNSPGFRSFFGWTARNISPSFYRLLKVNIDHHYIRDSSEISMDFQGFFRIECN